jgi:chaperonin cofactor prefoldin
MNIRFDRHARRRMKWRRISEEEVKQTLEKPDKIEESVKGRTNVYKSIGQRFIKVTYKKFSDEILIISVVVKA